MQQSTSIRIAPAIQEWLGSESKSFTALCGESFTRREVLQTAAGIILLATAICCAVHLSEFIASWLAGGAL